MPRPYLNLTIKRNIILIIKKNKQTNNKIKVKNSRSTVILITGKIFCSNFILNDAVCVYLHIFVFERKFQKKTKKIE
jgi:hypothetical protein